MDQHFEGNYCTYSELAGKPRDLVRKAFRLNRYAGHTAGLCPEFVQCNLVILEQDIADEFKQFCLANPIPCPLLGVSIPGEPHIPKLGRDVDLRTDLPLYRIYEQGRLTGQKKDIKALWKNNHVAFAIGCSFTFEKALSGADISMRHIEENVTVPMFETNLQTKKEGRFGGPVVVSMRPVKKVDLDRVNEICSRYPHAHGKPLHIGEPIDIGIGDIQNPDWGEAVSIREDEEPVFWGCGVTTQSAIATAKPVLCITHAPGAMLITDVTEKEASGQNIFQF